MPYAVMSELSLVTGHLKALRDKAGLSVRRIALELGMSSSAYSHYELRYKRTWLPMEFAEHLSAVLSRHGVDPREVMALAGVGVPSGSIPEDAVGQQQDLVPVYNVAASAGPGAMVDWEEEVVERLAFPQGYLRHITSVNPIHLKIISVKGRSMEPTLREDDVVMIDVSKRDLSYEGIFVIQDGGHSMLVKRISRASRKGFVMLVSDNRDHPPVERALEDIAVIGKVVWAGVKM